MHKESMEKIIGSALQKKQLLDSHPWRYLLSAALAGAYVGLGIILIFSVGAPLAALKSSVTSLVMGASFGIALILVVFAGAELFTGNHMFYTISTLSKATRWSDLGKNWVWCFMGNLIGALVLSGLVWGTGLFSNLPSDHLLFASAANKMTLPFSALFFRGILCNWFVCLALWTSTRTQSDVAKLLLIWWMLFGFIASGYEHSVANMTVLSLALMVPHPETITWAGWLHNMIPVTMGNIVGGAVFVGLIYWIISPVNKNE